MAPNSQAERRQITIVFADLADSTALSVRLDPEDLNELVTDYQNRVAGLVDQHGGFVARYVGDGILIYFGFPNAEENDAERAVRCGLEIARAVPRMQPRPGLETPLQVRVGIATGWVVTGDVIGTGAAAQVIAVGATPNLAARLQSAAGPGMVVISDTTRRLLGQLFACTDLGKLDFKGFPEPIQSWAVLSEQHVASRFVALRSRHLPLIGREDELRTLMSRWEQARGGEGNAVFVIGEPGIGKSRLISALQESVGSTKATFIHLMCVPHALDTALYPVAQMLLHAALIKAEDAPALKRRKLRDLMLAALPGGVAGDAFETVMSICNIAAEGPTLSHPSPMQQKAKALELIRDYVIALAASSALALLVEDLHWADPTTAEWLKLLVDSLEGQPILLSVTTRPDTLPPWIDHHLVKAIVLSKLNRRQATGLVAFNSGDVTLPERLVARIIARADGIPLFIEELTFSTLEEMRSGDKPGASPVTVDTVPVSLQASLMGRLDRLGEGREIAQIGAVIGRTFRFDLVRAISRIDAGRLAELLEKIVQSGLVTAAGSEPERAFSFRHSLVQETAYASLTRERQRAIHGHLANILEEQVAAGAVEPQLLAWHLGKAGETARSVDYYIRAAEQPVGRFALAERARHWSSALSQVALLPKSAETVRRELLLRTALARVLIDLHGSGSDLVRTTLERAVELCRELQDPAHFVIVFDALALNHYFARSNPDEMNRYANELFDIAETYNDFNAGLWARRIRGSANYLCGRFADAKADMLTVTNLYAERADSSHDHLMARDPRVSTFTNLGLCLTAMGEMKAGVAAREAGIAHARALTTPASAIVALRRACVQGIMRRRHREVMDFATRLFELNTEHETFAGTREGLIARVWAGHDGDGLDQLRTSMDELERANHTVNLPFFIAAAAERIGQSGDRETAVGLLDHAMDLCERTGETWYLAEIWRLRSELSDLDEAARLLADSLDLARRQGARLWELRAGISLAKHQARGGCPAKAKAILEAAIAEWPAQERDHQEYREAAAFIGR